MATSFAVILKAEKLLCFSTELLYQRKPHLSRRKMKANLYKLANDPGAELVKMERKQVGNRISDFRPVRIFGLQLKNLRCQRFWDEAVRHGCCSYP